MTTMREVNSGAREILLVEDNPADVRLTQEVLKENKVPTHMSIAEDGEKALAMLRKTGPYADAPRPDLILLDLNLPRMGGDEVLAAVKSDPALKRIPVVILSTSHAEADVLRSYDLHANAYVTKPVDLNRFIEAVKCVEDFWLGAATLPS